MTDLPGNKNKVRVKSVAYVNKLLKAINNYLEALNINKHTIQLGEDNAILPGNFEQDQLLRNC